MHKQSQNCLQYPLKRLKITFHLSYLKSRLNDCVYKHCFKRVEIGSPYLPPKKAVDPLYSPPICFIKLVPSLHVLKVTMKNLKENKYA